MTGTLELNIYVFEFGGCWPCFKKRQQPSKHCHQHYYWEFEDLSFCQTFSANSSNTPSKVNYVLCLLIAEYSSGPSDHLPCTVPSAYRSGTWIFALGDSFTLLLKKTPFQWTTVIQEAFNHHDVAFTSTPVPLRFRTALYSEVKLFKPSSWNYIVATKAQFFPRVCISFLQLRPSETW